jgi:hypothetical protein
VRSVPFDRIAFWLMHPAAHRRIERALKERYDIEDYYMDRYGRAVSDVGAIAGFGDCAPTVEAAKKLFAVRVRAEIDRMAE